MWAVATSGWMVANAQLGMSVGYPIVVVVMARLDVPPRRTDLFRNNAGTHDRIILVGCNCVP